jgi:hypothetical protein
MKKIVLTTLVLTVFLAGCTIFGAAPGMPSETNGIIIKDFGFSPSEVYAGQSAGLTLTLQNVGGAKGILGEITIFGIDAPSPNAGSLTWGYGSGDDFTLDLITELFPPDPTTGFDGEEYFQDWVPESPTGITAATTYDFLTRVKYLYTTTFTGKIQIVDNDYLRTLSTSDSEALIKVSGVQDATVTGGPLSLTAASGRSFIVREGDPSESRDIKFKITNVGSGYPYKNPWSDDNLHIVTVVATDGISCSVPDVRLSRGKTGLLTCAFTTPAQGTFTNKIDKIFSITLGYGYYIDSATSITVNPELD